MSLAYCARLYENELVCDMAEVYHVLDWRSLPARLAATLVAGLRDNTRVKMAAAGRKISAETLLSAVCADALRIRVWQSSKDGVKGKNPPESLLELLIAGNKPSSDKAEGFADSAEFMAWREKMLGGEVSGG